MCVFIGNVDLCLLKMDVVQCCSFPIKQWVERVGMCRDVPISLVFISRLCGLFVCVVYW